MVTPAWIPPPSVTSFMDVTLQKQKAKGPHAVVKVPMKVKGPTEVNRLTEVNFKQGGSQFFSLTLLANLSPALPLPK